MNHLIDLVGDIVGRLRVVAPATSKLTPRGKKLRQWLCICECGRFATVAGANLRGGLTKSCGCLRADAVNQSRALYHELADGESTINAKWKAYTKRAEEKQLRFELTREEFVALLKGNCFYCDEPPKAVSGRKTTLQINGIDRVDNNDGYTVRNSVSCCKRCNFAKADQDITDFANWVRRLGERFSWGDPPDKSDGDEDLYV